MKKIWLAIGLALVIAFSAGCSRDFFGGAAVGAGGAGAAYEYQNKKAIDELDRELESGRINEDEYLRRKKEIEDRSIVY